MKLYYTPGVCSLSPHIVLSEADFDYELIKVDLKTKKTESGADFNEINERSSVPFLVLDNSETLTEGVAIIQYLADQKPETGLAPASGTLERTRLHEILNFISTELHKSHTPLFYKEKVGEQAANFYTEKLKSAYAYIAKKLGDKPYLMGDQFTVADAYLFTLLGWESFLQADFALSPTLIEYKKRVAARPAVQRAMQAEGLLEQKAA
ncbi:MAG: glutathione transferase GstA [Alphaproteobacteria bacterium]